MKLPNWFKIIWWLLITGLVSWLFITRIPALANNNSAPVDVFIFLVLVALLLVPIFQEVSFFGVRFKQAVDDLKNHVSTQLSVFKADIQSTIVNSNTVNVNIPTPPPDGELPAIGEQIREAIAEITANRRLKPQDAELPSGRIDVDEQTVNLFKIRHTIEKKIRSIASYHTDFSHRRPPSISRLLQILVEEESLPKRFANGIREIYSICSPAIHGQPVTKAQIEFANSFAKEAIDVLSEIERRVNIIDEWE